MWNKRTVEEAPKHSTLACGSPVGSSAPAPTAPKPIDVEKESTASLTANIGKAVKIVGQIYSKEELYVDGDLEGALKVDHKLTVGPNGTVHAGIKAGEVLVLGTIQGNVEAADRIEIRKDANLVGDIRTARIIIEDGAYFKGSIDIISGSP